MESRYFDGLRLGSGGSGSSKKGKKSNSDKPKQPQRGLGVAQLEKIRLESQMNEYVSSFSSPFHNDLNMEDSRVEMAPSSSSSSSSKSGSSLSALHPSMTMIGYRDAEIRNFNHGEHWPNTSARSQLNQGTTSFHYHMPSTATLPLFEQHFEDSAQKKIQHDRSLSMGSISQNSDTNDAQELDLELRLSI